MSKSPKVTPPQDVKKDAGGAFARSQADSHNNGALAIDPAETDPSKHKDNTPPAPTPNEPSKD